MEPEADEGRLRELLDERFGRLGLGSGWLARAERTRAERMVAKLAEYVRASRRAQGAGCSRSSRAREVRLGRAVIKGRVDRLEVDADGRVVVVDLKTGKSAPAVAEVARNPQLGVYQLAVQQGGFDAGRAGDETADPAGPDARVPAAPTWCSSGRPGCAAAASSTSLRSARTRIRSGRPGWSRMPSRGWRASASSPPPTRCAGPVPAPVLSGPGGGTDLVTGAEP